MIVVILTHLIINTGVHRGSLVPHLLEEILTDRVLDVDAGVGVGPQENPGENEQAGTTGGHEYRDAGDSEVPPIRMCTTPDLKHSSRRAKVRGPAS